MATIVKKDERFARCCLYNTQDNNIIFVTDFEDGVVKVAFTLDCTPESMARIIAQCFDKDSNFKEEILKEYNSPSNQQFTGIEVNVFGNTMLVTKENASISEISSFIRAAIAEIIENIETIIINEMEKKEKIKKDMHEAMATQEIQFNSWNDKQNWMAWSQDIIYKNDGKDIVFAGEVFARYVQFLIEKRGMPEWAAFDEGYDAVVNNTPVDGAKLQIAFDMLIKCWKHGKRLSMWNDDRSKKELEAFLNNF